MTASPSTLRQGLKPADVVRRAPGHQHIQLQRILRITDAQQTTIGEAWTIHLAMAAVHQDHAIGLMAAGPQILQQGEKAAIAAATEPSLPVGGLGGRHRVSHPHKTRHPLHRQPFLGQLQQGLMVPRSCAYVEIFPQGEDPMAAGDVLIDQHQQACLLERPRQHELDVGCADVSSGSGLGPFAAIGIASQVGGDVQKERSLQSRSTGLLQQLVHQVGQHLLKTPLTGHIPWHQSEYTVEIDGG